MSFKSSILFIWGIWDPIYYACTRLRYVGNKQLDHNVFRVRLTRYKGRNVRLSDGTYIQKNDLLLKIHLHNVLLLKELLQLENDIRKGKLLYRRIRHSLPGLARYLRNHPRNEEIKAIIGITMLNRGADPLGFETVDICNLFYKVWKWVTLMPIYVLSTEQPIKKMKKNVPSYLFMPKQKLLNSYVDTSS